MGSLQSAIDETFLVDIRALPDDALQEDIGELIRAANRINAAFLTRLEVLDRRGAVASEHGSTVAWLREKLNVSATVAGRQVRLSRDLADVLPETAAKLADGDISVAHCQVIASLRRDLDDDAIRAADPHLADAATTHTPHELLGFVSHVRHAYRPDLTAGKEKDAYDERQLTTASTIGGLGTGRWSGDPISQEIIMTAIHAASAPNGPKDPRSAAQRRFDGLVTICERALKARELPETGGVAPHVSVIVDYATLMRAQGSPAATLGVGTAISADAARMLGCDGSISRIITGPHGEILDSGRATRTFTAAQRRAIIARDRHCQAHHCDTPAARCDIHHKTHWADGGHTNITNATLLCGRHHRHHHRQHQRDQTGTDPPEHSKTDRGRHMTDRSGLVIGKYEE
jgi:hypothetical protein